MSFFSAHFILFALITAPKPVVAPASSPHASMSLALAALFGLMIQAFIIPKPEANPCHVVAATP
jgi:hypothetical protein